jgi:hypothetical protein
MMKKKFQDSEFYFDDCPICRVMKKAENEGKDITYDELKKAFKEAKAKGAVVVDKDL